MSGACHLLPPWCLDESAPRSAGSLLRFVQCMGCCFGSHLGLETSKSKWVYERRFIVRALAACARTSYLASSGWPRPLSRFHVLSSAQLATVFLESTLRYLASFCLDCACGLILLGSKATGLVRSTGRHVADRKALPQSPRGARVRDDVSHGSVAPLFVSNRTERRRRKRLLDMKESAEDLHKLI